MTSAHRPTFVHAKGRKRDNSSKIQHERALNSHKRVKLRAERVPVDNEFEEDHEEEDGAPLEKEAPIKGDQLLLGESVTQESNGIGEVEKKEEQEEEDQEEDNNKDTSSDFSEESDDEEELLKELQQLKELESSEQPKNELEVQESSKKSWRNTKRKQSIKKVENFGNDLMKSDQHSQFMNKYIK